MVCRRKRPDKTGKQVIMKQRRDEMDVIDERALVYVAVLFVCSAVAVFAGPARAAATFGFVTASVEGAYWLGRSLAGRYVVPNEPVSGVEGDERYAS
jgi:hypothetical protein